MEILQKEGKLKKKRKDEEIGGKIQGKGEKNLNQ